MSNMSEKDEDGRDDEHCCLIVANEERKKRKHYKLIEYIIWNEMLQFWGLISIGLITSHLKMKSACVLPTTYNRGIHIYFTK